MEGTYLIEGWSGTEGLQYAHSHASPYNPRRLLVHPKDKVEHEEQGKLVYEISRKGCGAGYTEQKKDVENAARTIHEERK